MGEFVSMSGVCRASRRDVLKALEDFAVARGGTLAPAPGGEPFEHLILAGEDFGPVTVMYPNGFYSWDEASKHLSEALGAPVISLHIHDGDLWTYVLYRDGDEIDRFNPIPDYFSGFITPEERASWSGDAAIVAENWNGIDATSIERYLVTWNFDDDGPDWAYQTDQRPIGDCWQMLDFMGKLGLRFPEDDQGQATGETYTFNAEPERHRSKR